MVTDDVHTGSRKSILSWSNRF